MIFGIIWSIAAVLAASTEEAVGKGPSRKRRRFTTMMRISPLTGLTLQMIKYDKGVLLALSQSVEEALGQKILTRNNPSSFYGDRYVETVARSIMMYILQDPSPKECIQKRVVKDGSIAKYAMLANILRMEYTLPGADELLKLSTARKAAIVFLDAQVNAQYGQAPVDFLDGKDDSLTAYDIMVYLFVKHSGADEYAVQKKFLGVLEAGYEDMRDDTPGPIAEVVIEMVNYLLANNFQGRFGKYHLYRNIMSFFISTTDRSAISMLNRLNQSIITPDEVIKHMNDISGRANVRFALMYIPHVKEMQSESDIWELDRFFDFFWANARRLRALCDKDRCLLKDLPVLVLYQLLRKSRTAPENVPGLFDFFTLEWDKLPRDTIDGLLEHARRSARDAELLHRLERITGRNNKQGREELQESTRNEETTVPKENGSADEANQPLPSAPN
ncbi:hypothetical protein PAPHI01_2472 [Pancytospora philotis]|nr:hypothetical protein PAPHI01_2472 [Pancytospora philotis]